MDKPDKPNKPEQENPRFYPAMDKTAVRMLSRKKCSSCEKPLKNLKCHDCDIDYSRDDLDEEVDETPVSQAGGDNKLNSPDSFHQSPVPSVTTVTPPQQPTAPFTPSPSSVLARFKTLL